MLMERESFGVVQSSWGHSSLPQSDLTEAMSSPPRTASLYHASDKCCSGNSASSSGEELSDDNEDDLEQEECDILMELLELHKRLNRVRLEEEKSGYTVDRKPTVLVCSNNVPYKIKVATGKTGYQYFNSESTLLDAMESLKRSGVIDELKWFSWPGCAGVDENSKIEIQRKLNEENETEPIFLPVATAQGYLEFCDEVLWPIFTSTLVADGRLNLTSGYGDADVLQTSAGRAPASSLVSTSSTVDVARTPILRFGGGEYSNKAVAASLVKTPVGNQQWSTFSISTPLFSSTTIDSNSSSTDVNLLASMSVRMAMFTEVNKRYLTKLTVFLDTMGDEKDAHVVVYDIGLMLLPKMLRSRFQEIRCTYVMGIPFPSYSVFCMFPHRQELLEGILGADVIIFDHFEFVENFLTVCERILGLSSTATRLVYEGRIILLSVSPRGISPKRFKSAVTDVVQAPPLPTAKTNYGDAPVGDPASQASTPEGYADIAAGLIKLFEDGQQVVLSYDRISPSAGITQRLSAIARFFELHPVYWTEKRVKFVQILYGDAFLGPQQYARETLKRLTKQIDRLASSVNGRFGAVDYVPIHIIRKQIPFKIRVGLWKQSDVAFVNILRGGINLFGLEFIASQEENNPGTLVYSEFAGCASSLKGALIINPYDADEAAKILNMALSMPKLDRQLRISSLQKYVDKYTASRWSHHLLSEMRLVEKSRQENAPLPLPQIESIGHQYKFASKRLFILTYNGVLGPDFSAVPHGTQAVNAQVASLLKRLCDDALNTVYVIGGHNTSNLEAMFAGMPNLGLIGEYGFTYSMPQAIDQGTVDEAGAESTRAHLLLESATSKRLSRTWHLTIGRGFDIDWKEDVQKVMSHFVMRTPGAFVDTSYYSCVVWRYQHADREVGDAQTKELFTLLKSAMAMSLRSAEVILSESARAIVVRPRGCNNAVALSHVFATLQPSSKMAENPGVGTSDPRKAPSYDFCVCMGSHRYDLPMFKSFSTWYRSGFLLNAYGCVLPKITCHAQYYLENKEAATELLEICLQT